MQPVTLCVTGRGASPEAFPRGAWERSPCGAWESIRITAAAELIVPTLLRGNAVRDAPRHWTRSVPRGIPTRSMGTITVWSVGMQPVTLCVTGRGASPEAFPRRAWERSLCGAWESIRITAAAELIVPTLLRGNAARDALRHWTRSVPRGIPTRSMGTITVWGVGIDQNHSGRRTDRSHAPAWECSP